MRGRIQKILSAYGVVSRRKAEEMIQAGRISCNGQVCVLGDIADATTDQICVDGRPLSDFKNRVYIMLHKPRGFVTTLSDEKGRKRVIDLVADCGVRVYPVGRLDMDTEGLLLLTNDGDFANTVMHPKREVDKVYLVYVRGYTTAALHALRKPISLDGYTIRAPLVEAVWENGDRAQLKVTIHEGRNRQVRRMCAAAGLIVERLKRVAEGAISLGELPKGKWRYLTEAEVRKLQE